MPAATNGRPCVRPPHPDTAELTEIPPALRRRGSLSRFASWVRVAPLERAPLPAVPAAWASAELLHLLSVPGLYPAMGTLAATGLAYGLAHRQADDGTEKLSPAEIAAITGTAGGWLVLGDWAGPLSGWPPWLTMAYLAVSGCGWAWLRGHAAARANRARRAAAAAAAAKELADKTEWHRLAAMIGLKGSHLLAVEDTYLGDRRLIDTRGTGKRASSLASADLEERIAEIEMLPPGRVQVTRDRIAGRMWVTVRRRDPWARPVMHPAASGELDPAAEFARHVPAPATITKPLTIGIDPETGAPLQLSLWEPGGARVVSITAKKEGGKTTLLDSLRERITACEDAVLMQINMSKALEDRWWAPAAGASALDGDFERALDMLEFGKGVVEHRPRADRDTRVHRPTRDEPAYVFVLDEIDALAADPEGKAFLQAISSKCRSEGVILILVGQRNTAAWVGGANVRSNIDIAVWGKFARDGNEKGHVAGSSASLPSMSEYGEGHPGVFGVAPLPFQGDYQAGRTFYWGEEAAGIRRLIGARAAAARPHRLEPALAGLQELWDRITGPGPAGGTRPAPRPQPGPPAPPARAGGRREEPPAPVADRTARTRDTLAGTDETLDGLPGIPSPMEDHYSQVVAQRAAQALAANYGNVQIPAAALTVLMPLLAAPGGTTASAAGDALAERTGSGSKSVAHRYLSALRAAGIARLEGSGRGARFRLDPGTGGPGPGLTVVPDPDPDPGDEPDDEPEDDEEGPQEEHAR